MSTSKQEFAHTMHGVAGRMLPRHARDAQRFSNQTWISETRAAKGHGKGALIRIELRYDDECSNGHNTFSMTGTIWDSKRGEPTRRADNGFIASGCVHDDAAKAFPELAHLIPWHLTSDDEPMHYASNAVYLAGDRDHWGLRKGEASTSPKHQETRVLFGTSPVSHKVGREFAQWLRTSLANGAEFQPVPVEHAAKPGETYKFAPKFTFANFPREWHDCPFDTEQEAREWAQACNAGIVQFTVRPTLFGEGKERQLDAARAAACWPEATDAQLCAEPDELRAMLAARLPALQDRFRTDMRAAGFALTPSELTE